MKLLPFVVIGLLWVGAYIVGGWQAIAIMAVVGVLGEVALLGATQLRDRRAP